MYVALGGTGPNGPLPSASDSNFLWASVRSFGAELVDVDMTNTSIWGPGGPAANVSFPLVFSIAVFGWDGPADYTIEALSTAAQPLTAGLPQAAALRYLVELRAPHYVADFEARRGRN